MAVYSARGVSRAPWRSGIAEARQPGPSRWSVRDGVPTSWITAPCFPSFHIHCPLLSRWRPLPPPPPGTERPYHQITLLRCVVFAAATRRPLRRPCSIRLRCSWCSVYVLGICVRRPVHGICGRRSRVLHVVHALSVICLSSPS